MISELSIQNFRSIKSASLPLSKINILTGANNSGKSSVIYSLMAYKSFVDNPNRTLDQILALPTISLGPFKEIVFNKDESLPISLQLTLTGQHKKFHYPVELKNKILLHPVGSKIELESVHPEKFTVGIDIGLPYSLNKIETFKFSSQNGETTVRWNGFDVEATFIPLNKLSNQQIEEEQSKFQIPFDGPLIRSSQMYFAPIERGFKQPVFGAVPITNNQAYTESEIASQIATDSDLAGRIAHYLEKIVDRYFVVNTLLGTSSFRLQTRDKKTGFTTDVVNEGLGTNQLITILAKILDKEALIVCIDEPENHLHPSVIDKLVDTLVEIAENERRQFILSTHSEHLIHAILGKVRDKKLAPEDVNIFYAKKAGKQTEFELQPINDKGQITGGLKSFYEEELKNLKDFFKVDG